MEHDFTTLAALASNIRELSIRFTADNAQLHEEFFVSASNVKDLVMFVKRNGSSGIKPSKLTIPALDVLAIFNSEDWYFYSASNNGLWDFHKLELLQIWVSNKVLDDFLDQAAPEHFPCLKSLFISLSVYGGKWPLEKSTDLKLLALLGSLSKLKNLALPDFAPKTLIPALSNFGSRLRSIRFAEEAASMSPDHLRSILYLCPSIVMARINTLYKEVGNTNP